MRRRYLYLYPLFIVASMIGVLYLATPKAKAALAGENGPVLYIDNPTPTNHINGSTDQQLIPIPTSEVITTDPSGSDEITAATSSSPVTSATISDQTNTGNYDIVYATKECQEEEFKIDGRHTCPTDAVLNKVTIDQNRDPITDPVSMTLDPLEYKGKETHSNWVYGTSYSPDGVNVLITQAANYRGDVVSALEIVNTESFSSSSVTTIVDPAKNKCLSGGYAEDGTIFYTSCPVEKDPARLHDSNYQSKESVIYYIAPGETTAKEITINSKIKPYFIDVSPDSSQLLVADISTRKCRYADRMLYSKLDEYTNCNYYYIDVATGAATKLGDFGGANYVPMFYSPDGEYLIGTVYVKSLDKCRSSKHHGCGNKYDEMYTATVPVDKTSQEPTWISDLIGVQEWSPVAVVTTTSTTTTTPAVAITETLPSTGANSNILVALALIMVALGASAFAKTYRLNN